MRGLLISALSLSALASQLLAAGPPGPPPYACRVDGLCETGKDCIWMPNVTPTTFFAFKDHASDAAPALFRFEGLRQRPSLTALFDSFETARNWVFAKALTRNIAAVMTPSSHVADAHGFQVYDVQCFASGKCRLSAASVLVSCNSV